MADLYGLLGPGQSYGGLLSPEEQQAAQRQAMLAMGAGMLANSGYSPQRQTFGQALGTGLQTGQAAKTATEQDMLQAMLLKVKMQQAAQKAGPKTHVVGNALVDDEGNVIFQNQGLDNIYGRINPGDYTPESLAKFDKSKDYRDLVRVWAPPSPTVVNMGGAPNLVQGDRNGAAPRITPLSTLPNEISALTQKAGAEAEAKARGQVTGEALGGIEKKAAAAENVKGILDLADPLIDLSTGSAAGAAADKVAAMFGRSLDGAQAAAQLQILQAGLMFAQPRMEGPQGVLDVQLYEKAAGQIGDPTVPAPTKKAAVRTIRALQDKYKEQAERLDAPTAAPGAPKRVKVDAQGNVIGN